MYTYNANNPLIYTDPSGHCFTKWLGKSYCQKAWNAVKQDAINSWEEFKEVNSSWGTSFDYWTFGLLSQTKEYIQISKDDPLSVKQFASAALLMMAFWPGGRLEKGGAELTSTVWGRITGTQSVRAGTNIPTSFVLNDISVNGHKLWVHGNASKHLAEYMDRKEIAMLSNDARKMIEQSMLASFESAVKGIAIKDGRHMYDISGWQIGINITDEESVIYHAVYKGN